MSTLEIKLDLHPADNLHVTRTYRTMREINEFSYRHRPLPLDDPVVSPIKPPKPPGSITLETGIAGMGDLLKSGCRIQD